MNFADRLNAAIQEKASPCLLGLDPHLALLPFIRAKDLGFDQQVLLQLLSKPTKVFELAC